MKKIKKNDFFWLKSLHKLNKDLNLHSLYSTAGLWCNGNTTVFGAVFLGSSPSRPTEKPLRNERLFFMQKSFK